MRNKFLRSLFITVSVMAVSGLIAPGPIARAATNDGGAQSVVTLPPDLVGERFAVVGGQVTYHPAQQTAQNNTK